MLLKFIPGHFVEIYDEISKNNYIRTEGFVMFAGLSGFTAMSEKLSAKDKEGSEEISRILNTIFEDLINIIHKRGGSVYKFGGDALTVFFPKIVHARSVSNCGMELLEVMRKYDSIQTIQDKFKIEIKIGTTFGEVVIGQLGRDEKDYFIAGKALDKACECEHIAKKGESIVSCSLRFKLGMCEFKSKSEGYFIARELEELFNSKLSIKPIYNLNRIESFARKVLLNKDKEGDFGHGELRNCTTLFMSFSGIEYDYDFNYSVLNDLVTTVFKITSKYGGFINKVDMGGKGNKILILFGAPIATEKNEEFACRCALEIIESLNGSIKAKIGINSGNIYFGTIGSKNRMEFTVIGNAVNLSARLMTSCKDNEIIISKTTLSKISDTVTKNERGLILKGIKEKFIVSTLKGFYKKITYTRVKPIGRDGEIEEYRRIIHSGKIKKIFITAEAGLGKSVLAKEFEEIAGHNGKVFYAECLSHTSENPYYVIKELLNRFLDGISTNKIFALKQILSDVKEDSNLDIYANFMGLYHTKVRRDESMKNIIDDLTVSVCLNLLSRYKTYIFIEDVHWIDDQSLKILKKLLDLTGEMNCVFHLIFRPDDKLNDLRADGHDYAFEIEGFGKEEGESYLKQKFNIMKIPKKVYDLIYSKSKGNPFYMDEIILSIKSKNGIKEQKDGSYVINQKITEIEIPDNINDIILSRLDKIDGNSKRILKIASVIGRIFQINVLNQLKELQQKIGELNLKSRLSDLMDMNFTLFEINKEDECLFKHAITRDVIYEILPYSIRRKYHEEIAMIYEENSKDNLEGFYELLAFHYKLSGNTLKAKEYLLLSAVKSYNNFSYESALNFIAQYRKRKLSKEEKSESYLFEAEILKILEKRDKAIELCEKVKKSFDRGHKLFDKAVALNAFLLFKSNLYDKVLKEVKLFSKNTDINVFAQGYSFKGFAELFSGKTGNSEKTASKLYSLKNKVSDPKIKAIILNLSGNINLHKRNITIARAYFEDMLKIAIDNNLSDERLKALQNISVCHANAGEYKKAKEFLEKLYEEAVRIHNYDLIIVSINNIANMAYATGEYKSAERLAEKGLKIAQKYKKHILIDDILCCLANIKLKQGTIEEAL